jgi:hypothetical protein
MFGERFRAAANFRDERSAQPRLFVFVVLRRVVEFALGQIVEGDAHRSDPASRLAKHLVGWTA